MIRWWSGGRMESRDCAVVALLGFGLLSAADTSDDSAVFSVYAQFGILVENSQALVPANLGIRACCSVFIC